MLRGLRIVLDHLLELVELTHALVKGTLRVGWISGGIRGRGLMLPTGSWRVAAGIVVAPERAVTRTTATGAGVAAGSAVPIANVTAVAGAIAGLLLPLAIASSALLAALLTSLILAALALLLAVLAGLLSAAVSTQAAGLAAELAVLILAALGLAVAALPIRILAILSRLPVPVPRARHGFKLVAQPFNLIERRCLIALA